MGSSIQCEVRRRVQVRDSSLFCGENIEDRSGDVRPSGYEQLAAFTWLWVYGGDGHEDVASFLGESES